MSRVIPYLPPRLSNRQIVKCLLQEAGQISKTRNVINALAMNNLAAMALSCAQGSLAAKQRILDLAQEKS